MSGNISRGNRSLYSKATKPIYSPILSEIPNIRYASTNKASAPSSKKPVSQTGTSRTGPTVEKPSQTKPSNTASQKGASRLKSIPLKALNQSITSQLTTPSGARPTGEGGKPLPVNYKAVARRLTLTIAALPVLLVTSWVLWDRCEFVFSLAAFRMGREGKREEGSERGEKRREGNQSAESGEYELNLC